MTEVVYYLRKGDRIKIGWSGNLKARMRALRPDELLAIEPGCLHQETARHHHVALRLTNDEHRPVRAVADDEHGGDLSAAIRALLVEALAARTIRALQPTDGQEQR